MVSMEKKTLISHIWTDFHPHLFFNPHEYLLHTENWNSKTFVSKLFANGQFNIPEVYPYSIKKAETLYKQSFLQKLRSKIFEETYRENYNNWCIAHKEFRNTKIVHAHFGQTGIYLLPLLKKTNLPMVVSFYGVDGSWLLKEEKWVKGYQEMFQYTQAAVVLCEDVKKRLMNIG